MSNRTSSTRLTEREAPPLLTCVHRGCNGERFIVPLHAIVGVNRRDPMPGLASALGEMVALYGMNTEVSFCIGCGCLYPVSIRHPH